MAVPNINHLFTEEQIREVEDQVNLDIEGLKAGRKEDFLLLQSLRGNWSVEQFVSVAHHRGKSWRYLSALADAANEIQGLTMLHFIAAAAETAFTTATAQKVLNMLQRFREYHKEYKKTTGTRDDPIVNQIIQDAEVQLMEINKVYPQRLHARLSRLDDPD